MTGEKPRVLPKSQRKAFQQGESGHFLTSMNYGYFLWLLLSKKLQKDKNYFLFTEYLLL